MRPLHTVVLAALAASSPGIAPPPARAAAEESADARAPTVAVLRPADDDPVLVAAAARVQLELGATGVRSALIDAGEGYAARVAFVREDGVATIDVLGTPAAGAPIHRRVSVPRDAGGDDAAVLAIRAVEVLRGIRLEVNRPRPPAHPVGVATELAVEPARAATSERETWRFDLGVGAVTARPLGAAFGAGPVLAVAGLIAPHLSIAATFAGPFFTDRPATADGSAHTREELGSLGLRVDALAARAGVHAVAAVGLHHAATTFDERGLTSPISPLHVVSSPSVWAPMLSVAAGASWRFGPRWGVSAQCAALFVEPALDLVVNGHHVGTLGSPSLLTLLSAWTGI